MPAKVLIDLINSRDSKFVLLARRVTVWLMERTATSRLRLFEKHILGKKILDVGVGAGSMAKVIKDKGLDEVGIDVTNTSLYPEVVPVIYDGENISFKSRSRDTGLLICVLHHCSNPMRVLEETMRVCKRVIIIEDTYRNEIERILISARDNVGNFEFYQHDYHKTREWEKIFKIRGWHSIYTKEWSSLEFYGMYGRQTLFVIEPKRET